jgi:branched-chain amino acid transport system substrate-binding protein
MRGSALSTLLVAVLTLVGLASGCSKSEDSIKIGVIAPFSGPFASSGAEIEAGMRAYLKLHGETLENRKIELLIRDTTGPAPEVAKRLAQELVVRDKADLLVGFGLTPEALAVAPVATEAKKPMIVMNAATSIITTKSPYIVRVSFTVGQVTAPLAMWAIKNGISSVFTLVSDYAPGIDAENQFKKTFEAAGGKVVDSLRVPLQNPDFSPYVQRIKDAAPQAAFVFVPAGEQGTAFMKTFDERGLRQAGIQLLATGDVTEDYQLGAMGKSALGVVTTHQYSVAHPGPENETFLKAFGEVTGGKMRANFMAVAGYDGMALIFEAVRRLKGKLDPDQLVETLKGLELKSPRGPIRIDPKTRDIVQTIYVRRVEERDGQLYNVEFDQFPEVVDPGKE